MSDNTPDITPELLRSVATWLRDNAVGALPGKPMAAEFLDGAADDLEREQADEKLVNYALEVWFDARARSSASGVELDRVGMLAVLAKMDEERKAEPRSWNDLRNVPGDVKAVEDRDGNRWYRPPGSWGVCLAFTHAAPFTEVIDGE